MKAIGNILNNTIAVFVVVIIALIIVPLSSGVLDFMFVLNLSLSLMILLMSMYIKDTLEFSIYPSILLLTTLFRLALNISSTRSILSNHGYAGEVIRTFGEFVIQGNVVIGLVIYLIIVLVQFLVITKGAERVAEVSARFTLDAMPGKQMAIDADLSSGLITEEQARDRRSHIQREADFFGSMDGASKFVKGDAVLSIITTLINLIGGILVGVLNNEGDFTTIMNTYATSTVGDGLMGQIPSLLISVATGMIVTRSASEASLNTDVLRQFSAQPRVFIIAGIVMPFLILIGFPPVQVVLVAIMLEYLGITLKKRQEAVVVTAAGESEPVEEVVSEVNYYKDLNNVYDLLNVVPITIEVGYSLLPLVDESAGGNFLDRIVMLRKQFADEMGIVLPAVKLKDSNQINPNQYEIKLKGESIAIGDVLVDHYLGLAPPDITREKDVDGIDTTEPAFGMPAKWISEDKKLKAELAGYTLIDPTSVIITHLSEQLRRHAYELLTRSETKKMLDNLRKNPDNVVDEIVPSMITLNDLQKILKNLLREGVPIVDLETILETAADYSSTTKDCDLLTEYVRQSLKRTISQKYSEAGQLKVINLDSDVEDRIIKNVKKAEGGTYLALDPEVIQRIVERTTEQINKVKRLVQEPVVLTAPVVRVYFKKLIDQFYPDVTVLSFNDIDTNVQIQSLGTISLS